MKNTKLVVSVIVILLMGLVISSIIIFKPKTHTSYFYDEDVGIIKTQTKVYTNFISKLFKRSQQEIIFNQTTAIIGDTLSFTDEYEVIELAQLVGTGTFGCYIGDRELKIIKPDGTSIKSSIHFVPAAEFGALLITVAEDFTADQIGTWTAISSYHEVECVDEELTDCQITERCYDTFTETEQTALVVSDVNEEGCDLEGSDGSWMIDENITNGYIESRTPTIIDDDCEEIDGETAYRTKCDFGYQIVGTDGASVGSGQLTCEIKILTNECPDGTDEECPGQVCVFTECVDRACTGDDEMYRSCPDNTTLITHKCVDKILVETSNVCLDDTSTTDSNDTSTTDNDNTSTTDTTTTEEKDTKFPILLVTIVIILLFMGGVLGFIVFKKFKK